MSEAPIVSFKKRNNVGAAKQRSGITSTKSNDDDDDVAIIVGKSKMKADTSNEREDAKSFVSTVFESTREIVPQSYAGDANNALRTETETVKATGNVIGPSKAPEFIR